MFHAIFQLLSIRWRARSVRSVLRTVSPILVAPLCALLRRLHPDTHPPQISCPGPIVVNAPSDSNLALVSFTVNATDDSGSVTVLNNYNDQGGNFSDYVPIWLTGISFTARDAAGNEASCYVIVIVRGLRMAPHLVWRSFSPGRCHTSAAHMPFQHHGGRRSRQQHGLRRFHRVCHRQLGRCNCR